MNNTDHKSTELARLFYRELEKIHGSADWTLTAKSDALARLLELLYLEVTKADSIHFTTLFARIAYACHRHQVDKKTQYWVHFFRKKIRSAVPEAEAKGVYALGLKAVAESIQGLFGETAPEEVQAFLPKKIPFIYTEVQVKEYRKTARVIALADDEANDMLLAQDEENPSQLIHIQYNIAERNEPFSPTIREIRNCFKFPITLSLIDVQIVDNSSSVRQLAPTLVGGSQGSEQTTPPKYLNTSIPQYLIYRPRAIVVEPDYLMDVSTVANCFQGCSAEPVVYLLQKFLPVAQSLPMILGNIANFFLDELMHNPEAVFKETFPKVFKTNPLTFSLLTDAEIKEIYEKAQRHWLTLQLMVRQEIRKFDIESKECYLEPSFYDEKHGLQGRLDVFYKKENRSAIIELKSGKPFMPNRHGIGASHFIQTLLYDLMVRSVFGDEVEPASYILYSGLETSQLRYAPPVKAEQNEALQVRNLLVSIDRRLAAVQGDTVVQVPLLERTTTARFPHIKGYLSQSIALFEKTYHALDDLERRYFNAFTGLIAREHQLAKTGIQGMDKANGLAALWLDTVQEKEAGFDIIKSLTIKENHAFEEEPIIIFAKTSDTSPLANFRVGDIAVLYPVDSSAATHQSSITNHQSLLQTQIFKATILAITNEEVTVRLRYKQFNLLIFNEFENWNLEHDQMDMGFTSMYQGLFRWASAEKRKRDLLLGILAPNIAPSDTYPIPHTSYLGSPLTEEQDTILQKMLTAPDYFLLWGPPGTGKTSQMLRHFAKWIFENTDENLLLLAYTNRAVDEICEALESIGPEVRAAYLRIGSRYSTSEQFESQLLTSKIEDVTTRKELREVLENHRIFVSTLASLSNNQELLKLKKFRRVAIDEASQILEPVLAGLLPQFEQFVLIGDHKQLPAVVVQSPEASAVTDEKLLGIGLQNLRNSLFERLFRRCTEQGWHWAFDLLSHQGRMHEDIMRFPGEQFYEGKLKILPKEIPVSQKQLAPMAAPTADNQHDWQRLVQQQRIVFLNTPIDRQSPSRKTNRHEAELLAQLVKFFQPQPVTPPPLGGGGGGLPTIGIITPYRAQIAQIQEVMEREGVDCGSITIDTVERYQGGARDIILISLSTNAASQMETLVSLSEEGVDRKLNVALTRAREQVVVLGNEELLMRNEVYRRLIEWARG
ncbi:MAG: ATP-dependent helicase [Saprospiraceae bacterium]|nr:ATP-dependent helicase [Saprospiraceae bacterium]MCF8252788.1 ATP-dependent helicase [Saprospiraceae bacterium]MCF8314343.1 ATP-dependent helicase [Saprospiraceae bacterium]MCF8443215.1 ATP-dependent helicase [Saprospiraceae bacterium]